VETERGPTLLAIARGAIAGQLGEPMPSFIAADWLEDPGATFVTLQLKGGLRGCVGSLQARRPLREDVKANACAAAFQDPRFAPLSRSEYPGIEIEVSLLSTMEKLAFESQGQLLKLLRPGIDGLVLEYGWQRGTFLPQVWEQLPDPKTFLAQLKQKAGLRADFWSDGIQISRYTVEKWREHEHSISSERR
jgi:hypothetical protein